MSDSAAPTNQQQALSSETVCKVIQQLRDCSLDRWNSPSAYLAVGRLLATGKEVDDLTVREVRQIIAQAAHDYSQAYRAGRSAS